MDILSHGLWTGAVYKIVNKRAKSGVKFKLAVFWGLFPDLFAFSALGVWLAFSIIMPGLSIAQDWGALFREPATQDSLPIFTLTHVLYNASHSMVVFFAAVFAVYIARKYFFKTKRGFMPWEMWGWLLHILIDIPSHDAYGRFPTPFLWPVSSVEVDGVAWSSPKFMVINYLALLGVYLWFWFREAKKRKLEVAV